MYADIAKGKLTISGESYSVYSKMEQQLNTFVASTVTHQLIKAIPFTLVIFIHGNKTKKFKPIK